MSKIETKVKKQSLPKEEIIELSYVKGRQSIECTKIWKIGDVKFKIHIKVDSYIFQSHATCRMWDPNKFEWVLIYNIPYQNMASYSKVSYVSPGRPEDHAWAFQQDVLILTTQTYKIIL